VDNPGMLWDVFCRVIDNFGDIGVCWRLCADLAGRGHMVRLWVDDASPLHWMAPGALQGQWPGVQVLGWDQSRNPDSLAHMAPADVWVEGFGCEIAPEFIAHYSNSLRAVGQNTSKMPTWINLEYLSAESFVERCHGLPSPVMQGPAAGGVKYFFYPGFSPRTGGLLREANLLQRQAAFAQPGQRAAWLAEHGISWQGERLISLFCYEPPALAQLLMQLASGNVPTHIAVTAGRAAHAVRATIESIYRLEPAWNMRYALSISYLPLLSQDEYDALLWACDLNLVRGEDSIVRAIWAGKPFVWQIYPQDDAAHHAKLNAFLDMLGADAALRTAHCAWNSMGPSGGGAPPPPKLDCITALRHLHVWGEAVQTTRQRLMQMDDLATQLSAFVHKER